jgi:hypothetical protein
MTCPAWPCARLETSSATGRPDKVSKEGEPGLNDHISHACPLGPSENLCPADGVVDPGRSTSGRPDTAGR